jgi:L-erythro-3,5-diaminohexanoate dehydrogenase
MSNSTDPYGLHRVIAPAGALPQNAIGLNNDPEISDNEILINVEILNITSASFSRLMKELGRNEEILAAEIVRIVEERGKYQDPVLGSGGMLIGTVAQVGEDLLGKVDLKSGDRIATLVSLTATPLKINQLKRINIHTHQVWVDGQAVLFEKSLYSKLPEDIPIEISLALMDVAGAPAMTARAVKEGDIVLIIGGGKAGLLCLHESKKRTGITGLTIAIESSPARCEEIRALGLADTVVKADAVRPVEVMNIVAELTGGRLADFTVNVVNVADSEMSSILATKDEGTVFFYNTSTSFTKAALGAEAVGKPVRMLMGNGYVPGHAAITFQIMRENPGLRELFMKLYAR